jgi:ribonucleoside-diphosphate reductase alpha chain
VPTKDGRIMSLADGLATGLQRYLAAKEAHGLEALLLGRVDPNAAMPASPEPVMPAAPVADARPRNVGEYKLKCPSCSGTLAFQEGCVKCHGCGFSQC